MKIYNMEQRSEEWHAARRGVLTASKFDEVITPTGKLANSEKSRKYIQNLATDALIKENPHRDDSQSRIDRKFDIKWGVDHEPDAFKWFADNVAAISPVGFVKMGEYIPVGCSPDGYIPDGDEIGKWYAGLEMKCPSLYTHVEYLDAKVLPSKYKLQVHGSMAVTGLDRWYFLSYYPHGKVRPFLLEVKRDDFTEKVGESLAEFVKLYRSEFNRLSEIIIEKGVAA